MALSLNQIKKKEEKLHKATASPKIVKPNTVAKKPWGEELKAESKPNPSTKKSTTINKTKRSWLSSIQVYPKVKIPVPNFLHQRSKK